MRIVDCQYGHKETPCLLAGEPSDVRLKKVGQGIDKTLNILYVRNI